MNTIKYQKQYKNQNNGGYSRQSVNRQYYKKGSRSQNPKSKGITNRFFDLNSSFGDSKSEKKIDERNKKMIREIQVPNFG